MTIFGYFIITIIVLFLIFILLFTKVKIFYIFMFEHTTWKRWRWAFKNFHTINFTPSYVSTDATKFNIFNTSLHICCWHDTQVASIHYSNSNVFVGSFYEKKSKKLYKMLMDRQA